MSRNTANGSPGLMFKKLLKIRPYMHIKIDAPAGNLAPPKCIHYFSYNIFSKNFVRILIKLKRRKLKKKN